MKKLTKLYDIALIDTNNLCRRAQHAHADLTVTALGEEQPTGVVFGVARQILFLRERYPDIELIFCWDDGRNAREKLYPAYKAHRKPHDPAVEEIYQSQIKQVKSMLLWLGVTQAQITNEECDDVIYTLARRRAKSGERVLVVSNDYDFLQMITPKVHLLWARKGEQKIYDPNLCREEFGIEPETWLPVLAMAGDPSDNIKGVKGIGEKTAIALLKADPEFVDRLIAFTKDKQSTLMVYDFSNQPKRIQTAADEAFKQADEAALGYELVRLRRFKNVQITEGPPNFKKVRRLLTKLQFNSILDRFPLFSGE